MNIIKLIKHECANYFPDSGGSGSIKNYCCITDRNCIYFDDDSGRCNYFESSVLPLDPELQFKYREERRLSNQDLQKICKQCREPFTPKSRKQKYCDNCIEIRRKEQSKLRMRLKRKAG
jgi:hypothetical protein